MQFIDRAKIYIKSGKGGDGHVSFRRELYVPAGGPDGGDGGKGGDIIFVVDKSINTLFPFKTKYKYIAESGTDGGKKKCTGKDGENRIIKVPNGTIIRDAKSSKIIYDMTNVEEPIVLLKGGKGGIGNRHFATSSMQAPRYAKPGEKAKELEVILELKVLADVGLVGFPNVGKSTIITKVSNARPEINNYPFTTITPHLGTVNVDDVSFVMADIPGIIEGAANGVGLGFNFLKHIERTKVLLHVIDVASVEGRDPLNDLDIIFSELEAFNINLTKKKQLIAANKIDSIDEKSLKEVLDKINKKYPNIPIIPISAISNVGIDALLQKLKEMVVLERKNNKIETFDSEVSIDDLFENNSDEIIIEKVRADYFKLSGEKIKKMLGYTNMDTEKGMNYFQKFLKETGIIKMLKDKGMCEGATVSIFDTEFEYYD